jgi:hypothetical protein
VDLAVTTTDYFDASLPAVFGVGAVLYLWLAMRLSRSTNGESANSIAGLLFLIGIMLGGTGIWYNADDPNIYDIGRTLSFFSTGFLGVAFFKIYRDFTVGSTSGYVLGLLSIIPILSTALAATNEMHHLASTCHSPTACSASHCLRSPGDCPQWRSHTDAKS